MTGNHGEDENQPQAGPGSAPLGLSRELQLRLASGAVVALVTAAAIYAGPVPFAFLVFLVAAAMSWEWGEIVRKEGFDTPGILHVASVAAAAVLTSLSMAGLGVAAVLVGAIAVSALLFGGGQAKLSSLGVLYTGLPVVALVWMRSDEALGLQAVVFVLAAVVATDIAAYATGRTFGGPKLMPSVSPGKTWSGLAGGVVAAAIAGGIFSLLAHTGAPLWLAFLAALLALTAQAGDLAESALKRSYGLKDASNLIPGHGGFMDRMDGIVTASVLAALIALMIDAYAPARALLYGT